MSALSLVELSIGMAFLYLLLSIACSAVQEWLAQRDGARGRCLRQGLLRLLEDRWFYLRIINHPSMAALYRDVPGKPRPPAYAPPENFAAATLDTLLNKASKLDPQALPSPFDYTKPNLMTAATICADHGFAIGYALQPLIAAATDVEETKKAVGNWYQATMDRTSGWYKKSVQKRLLVLGFIAAAIFNVDSITVASSLLKSKELSRALADMAETATPGLAQQIDPAEVDEIKKTLTQTAEQVRSLREAGLPVGYACLSSVVLNDPKANAPLAGSIVRLCLDSFQKEVTLPVALQHLIGWLITGFAVSFGAPFWFDLLNKVINLRGTGVKPKAPEPA